MLKIPAFAKRQNVMRNFTRKTTIKIILTLTTFIFISCGQMNTSDSLTSSQPEIDTSISRPPSEILTATHSGTYVALTFINSYVDNSNKMRGAIGITEFVAASNLVTEEFKNELKSVLDEAYKEDPVLGLGADPILAAQDNPNKFVIDEIQGQYLIMRGLDCPELKLTMKVEQKADTWLVDGCGIINIPMDKRSGR